MAPHSSTLAWKIPQMEDHCAAVWGSRELDTTEQMNNNANDLQIL